MIALEPSNELDDPVELGNVHCTPFLTCFSTQTIGFDVENRTDLASVVGGGGGWGADMTYHH